mmetsp:Transcript_58297/g.127895  ORF Transcript_58297/g.127895 Transcript_58297/m.127895 type:complete len:330 (+) Transcript_58297:30-1019(+)
MKEWRRKHHSLLAPLPSWWTARGCSDVPHPQAAAAASVFRDLEVAHLAFQSQVPQEGLRGLFLHKLGHRQPDEAIPRHRVARELQGPNELLLQARDHLLDVKVIGIVAERIFELRPDLVNAEQGEGGQGGHDHICQQTLGEVDEEGDGEQIHDEQCANKVHVGQRQRCGHCLVHLILELHQLLTDLDELWQEALLVAIRFVRMESNRLANKVQDHEQLPVGGLHRDIELPVWAVGPLLVEEDLRIGIATVPEDVLLVPGVLHILCQRLVDLLELCLVHQAAEPHPVPVELPLRLLVHLTEVVALATEAHLYLEGHPQGQRPPHDVRASI